MCVQGDGVMRWRRGLGRAATRYACPYCVSRPLSYDLILTAILLGNHSDIALYARIDLEMILKLPAESCDLYGLAWAYAAHVYARRGVDERMNFA